MERVHPAAGLVPVCVLVPVEMHVVGVPITAGLPAVQPAALPAAAVAPDAVEAAVRLVESPVQRLVVPAVVVVGIARIAAENPVRRPVVPVVDAVEVVL